MQANDAPYLSTGAAARRLHLSRTTLPRAARRHRSRLGTVTLTRGKRVR